MKRPGRFLVALAAAGALALGVVGCGGGEEEAATTTAPATTAPTTTAPATTAPATTAPTQTEAPTETAPGDVAAGQAFFQQTCQGCHLNGGRSAGGVGPQLAGRNLTAQAIRNQIVNGGGGMPAGLAQGEDLDNVVAYVLSLQ